MKERVFTEEISLPASIGLILSLQNQCFEHEGERLWSFGDVEELAEIPHISVFLSRDKKGPVGFAIFLKLIDVADLLSVGVLPAARLKGCAERIFQHAHRKLHAEGVEKIFLEVRENNAKAQCLYTKLGYKIQGVRKKYYHLQDGNHMDAIQYAIDL